MTAEIAILNKQAIALATDSAVTIGSGKKIYNSADKLFALSKCNPVGIMIYGSANFLETPWEVLVKYYRQRILRKKSFGSLAEYAQDFIQFLKTTDRFPRDADQFFVNSAIMTSVSTVHREIVDRVDSLMKRNKSVSASDTAGIVKECIQQECRLVDSLPFLDGGSEEKAAVLVKNFSKEIARTVKHVFQKLPLDREGKKHLALIASRSIYKDRFSNGKAGIVFAGYGEDDLFPSIESFEIEGRVGDFLRYKRQEDKSAAIDLNTTSAIIAYAQSEMVHTFMKGIHPFFADVLESLVNEAFSGLQERIKKAFPSKASATKVHELRELLTSLPGVIFGELERYSRDDFIVPVLGTVDALPKDELAEMAEALISLTSFRRRVTPHAETVGGPIDVLVISKGDGLVWIKRKLYFDPRLNHHFFSNYYSGVLDDSQKDCDREG